MNDRPPVRRSGRPAAGRRRARGLGPGLADIARLGLLAVTFAGALNDVANMFRGASVSRSVDATRGATSLALLTAAASAVLMVALTLNVAFLVDRLFSRRLATYLFPLVFVLAAASVTIGYLGSLKLGAVVAISVLIPAAALVLNVLLVRISPPAPKTPPGRRTDAPARRRPSAPPRPSAGLQRPAGRPQKRKRPSARKH